MKINRIEHMCEGNGHVIIKELLDERADKEHEAFKALHQDSLAKADDAGLKALLAFLMLRRVVPF